MLKESVTIPTFDIVAKPVLTYSEMEFWRRKDSLTIEELGAFMCSTNKRLAKHAKEQYEKVIIANELND